MKKHRKNVICIYDTQFILNVPYCTVQELMDILYIQVLSNKNVQEKFEWHPQNETDSFNKQREKS